MRHLLLSLWISLSFAASAHAQGVATLTYQRGTVSIMRAQPPLAPAMPWHAEGAARQNAPAQFNITVDIRPSSVLYQRDGLMNMSTLDARSGMLFVFESPQKARIGILEVLQPVDMLWIDSEGIITTIAPNIALNEKRALADKTLTKAILLLAGGAAELNSIQPGDSVTGSEYFETAPSVLSMPQSEPISRSHK
jgi:uncharacterized membrane protein (UPF0127 family)